MISYYHRFSLAFGYALDLGANAGSDAGSVQPITAIDQQTIVKSISCEILPPCFHRILADLERDCLAHKD